MASHFGAVVQGLSVLGHLSRLRNAAPRMGFHFDRGEEALRGSHTSNIEPAKYIDQSLVKTGP